MNNAATEPNKPPATDPPPTPPTIDSKAQEQQGVFSAWGFDVNSVTNNISIGNLFSNETTDRQLDTKPDKDIGSTAANIAEVASVELGHASKAAQQTIGKAAEEIGKGWGTLNSFLDDMLAPKVDGVDEGDDMAKLFRSKFPELDHDDQLVDHFKCAMLQKYRCYLNNVTPEKAFPMRGMLFVTTTNIAMYVNDDGGAFGGDPFGVSMSFKEIGKIQKGANSMLRIVTKEQQSFIFGEFESDSHFNGALSLLEHMAAPGNAPQPPKEQPTNASNAAEKQATEAG